MRISNGEPSDQSAPLKAVGTVCVDGATNMNALQFMQSFFVMHQMPAAALQPVPSGATRPAMALALSGPASALYDRADEAASLLKALAHPDRLLLLCQLVDGERCVGDLGAATGIGQPSLSQQLAVLRAERLVTARRSGQRVLYRVTSPAALAVLRTLHTLFCPPSSSTAQPDPA